MVFVVRKSASKPSVQGDDAGCLESLEPFVDEAEIQAFY